MRIAFLVNDFPMLSETFILNQATGLLDRGHQVDIYTENIRDWSHVHPDVNCYRLQERTYALEPLPDNYFWRVLKAIWFVLHHGYRAPRLIAQSLNIFAYGKQALNLWLLYTAVTLLKHASHYDIIHCQFGTQGYRGLAFKRLLQPTPKLLLMFRGFDISCFVQEVGSHFYTKLFEEVDFCLANCDFFRKLVTALGWPASRSAVHFSGLDSSKFQFRPRYFVPGEPVKVATTGRLVEKKGIEYAIWAVAKQARRFPELEYYIIGDGPLRLPLEELIEELNAGSYIHLLGWKNEAEIIDILDTCHLFIAPSVTAADGNQDAPINVLKEAMAMGLPVVSTFHGGIPELVQDGKSGYLVPERDADALAEKLELLLAYPENWQAMGEAGRAFVKKYFDLNRLNDQLVSRYEQLIAESDNPQQLSLTENILDRVDELPQASPVSVSSRND